MMPLERICIIQKKISESQGKSHKNYNKNNNLIKN